MIIYFDGKNYYLSQNDERFLHGLWSFIQIEPTTLEQNDTILGYIEQHYTHFKLEARVILKVNFPPLCQLNGFDKESLKKLALSKADIKAIELLDNLKII